MKIFNKIGAFMLLIIGGTSCTTSPLLPPNYTGEEGGACPPEIISFKSEVLPLIVANCAMSGCHDVQTAEEGVVLDSYENIKKEVTPGRPNNSALYEYLIETGDDIMPPPPYPAFNTAQINLIKTWIEQGALNTTCEAECDTNSTPTFTAVIYPIMENACIGCHNNALAEGNINLSTYAHLKTAVNNGSLMGTIEHLTGYTPMPPSGEKLSDCKIQQIQEWINLGALDN